VVVRAQACATTGSRKGRTTCCRCIISNISAMVARLVEVKGFLRPEVDHSSLPQQPEAQDQEIFNRRRKASGCAGRISCHT